jgi:hypothetical protein
MKATIRPGIQIPEALAPKFAEVTNRIFDQINSVYASHREANAIVHIGKGKNKQVFALRCQFEREGEQLSILNIGAATEDESQLKFNASNPVPAIVRL